jgi:hypothetical protein
VAQGETGIRAANEAFGAGSQPWYERMRKRSEQEVTAKPPKGISYSLGVVSGLVAGALAAEIHPRWVAALAWIAIAGSPPWALDSWWRSRDRRHEETLIGELRVAEVRAPATGSARVTQGPSR